MHLQHGDVLLLDSVFLSDLKRFSDSNLRASKLSTYVNFPLKELDLREFASESSGECLPKMRRRFVRFFQLDLMSEDWRSCWLTECCLSPQSELCITCMQCPTTRETLWEATTQPTARTRRWGSGTATTTPGISSHICSLIILPHISRYQLNRKLCSRNYTVRTSCQIKMTSLTLYKGVWAWWQMKSADCMCVCGWEWLLLLG